MRKTATLIVALACIVLTAMAREFLIQLKSGEQIQLPVKDIAELRFDATAADTELPEDPYPSATDFSRKMLLIEHTGTYCGNCPLMVLGIHELDTDPAYSTSYTLAALHSYEGDPMGNALIREISSSNMLSPGWPLTTVNFRKEGVGAYERYQMTTDRLKTAIDADRELVPSGIASLASLDDRTLTLTLSMKAGEDGQYRVGAFVVEDGIKARQTNMYPEITEGHDFDTHNNVVRTVVGQNPDGTFTGLDLGQVKKGETAFTSQTIELGSGWKLENTYLVLYVTEKKGDSYVCVNSAYAPINGEASFTYDSGNDATDTYVYLPKTFVETESTGGAYTVPFEMMNEEDDARKVTASSTADWISGITVEGTEIHFNVADNPTEAVRTARISISYDGARPIDVTVRQNPKGYEENALFQIEATVTSPYSVSVAITPNGYEGNYLFLVAKASTIDSYIDAGNLQGWIEGDLEWLKATAEYNNLTLSELLRAYKNVYTMDGQPTIMTYSNLDNNTEYYIYCYGLTLDGEVTTDFYKKKFKTEVVATVDLTFTAEVTDLARYGANVKVTPSNDNDSYFWTYVSEMDWVKYDLDFIMDNMIKNVMYEVSMGYDIFDIIHIGPSSENIQGLWAGTKYHLVGWGMDEKGTPTTKPQEFGEFITLSDEFASDCSFEIETPSVTDQDIQVHVTPSDNTIRYYVAFIDESLLPGYDDYQMAQRIINMEQNRFNDGFYGQGVDWSNVDWMLMGEQTKWGRKDLYWTFSPNHTYRIYVFGIDANGTRNTDVFTLDRTTPAAPQSDMTIEIALDAADYQHGTFTFTPSNDEEYYIPLLVETEEMKYVMNPDGTINEAELCHQIEHYYDDTPNYYTHKGTYTQQFNWIPDRDYTMLVCGWSGGNTTRFYTFETHSPAIPFNEGKGDVECSWELFDATELSKLDYDRWADYRGYVVIRLNFTPNDDAAFYCGGVWMPASTYEDVGSEAYLLMLIQNPEVSIVNRPTAMYRTLTYGETYSLSYIAKDKEGRLGPWHYEEITPKQGVNITEAYDFWTRPSETPSKVIAISPEGRVVDIKMPDFSSKTPFMTGSKTTPMRGEGMKKATEKPATVIAEDILGRN